MSALLKPDCHRRRPGVEPRRRRRRCAPSFASPTPGSSSVAEQTTLLGVARTTLYQWKQGKVAPLDRHLLERLSHLFGIYSSLQILFPASGRADEWMRKANSAPLFAGRSALDRMLGGQVADLFVVRQYLDAQRGGKA